MLVNLTEKVCCVCGVVFGMAVHHAQQRREDQKEFHCPNGHAMQATRSEAETLREKVGQLEAALVMAQEEATQENALRQDIERKHARLIRDRKRKSRGRK